MGVNFVDAFSDWECLRLRLEFALLRSVMRALGPHQWDLPFIALRRTAGAEQGLDQAVMPAVPGFNFFMGADGDRCHEGNRSRRISVNRATRIYSN
jgi:hypothetical protein